MSRNSAFIYILLFISLLILLWNSYFSQSLSSSSSSSSPPLSNSLPDQQHESSSISTSEISFSSQPWYYWFYNIMTTQSSSSQSHQDQIDQGESGSIGDVCQQELLMKDKLILKMKKEIQQLKNENKNFKDKFHHLQQGIDMIHTKDSKFKSGRDNSNTTWATSLIGPTSLPTTSPHSSPLKISPLFTSETLQAAIFKDYNSSSSHAPLTPEFIYGNLSVVISDQLISIDDIIFGYQILYERASLFSYTNFFGISLQQDPSDAFALMDLIWRLQPDLIIELGTAGGGSAFFYAMIMTAYNSNSHVITLDPKRLYDWNIENVKKVCSHCKSGRDTPLWNSETIHFLPLPPTEIETTRTINKLIDQWNSQVILVIDDSNHLTETVRENLEVYSKYVTPGSYFIVQDMKMERLYRNKKINPPLAVREFLETKIGQNFIIDRSFEYYIYTQHAKGYLKRIQ